MQFLSQTPAVALNCLSTQRCIALLFCAEEVIKKALSLTGEIFSAAARKRHRQPGRIFFRLIFGQRKKFGDGGQIRRLRGLCSLMLISTSITTFIGRPFVERFALCYRTIVMSVLSRL